MASKEPPKTSSNTSTNISPNTSSNINPNSTQSDTSAWKEGDSLPHESGSNDMLSDLMSAAVDVPSDTNKKKLKKISYASIWDPLSSKDWDSAGPPSFQVDSRIKRDLSSMFREPLPGIFAFPDEKNLCIVHCLVLGPFETPYEGGFFHFVVRFGPSYPWHPPRVRFMTTDAGAVRFNPNLYADGKVCLSLLGTWSGPAWSPAINLGALLLSIQSLMNDKPYYNEPGFKTEHYPGESKKYNMMLIHETIRVAVCGQLETILNSNDRDLHMPSELADVIKESFCDLYDEYIEVCQKEKHQDGQEMTDIFCTHTNRRFKFSSLLEKLHELKERLNSTQSSNGSSEKESSVSSFSDEEIAKARGSHSNDKPSSLNSSGKTATGIDSEDV